MVAFDMRCLIKSPIRSTSVSKTRHGIFRIS